MPISTRFTSSKFVTRGVANTVGLDVQLILWGLIVEKRQRGIELDYLQIFELSSATIDGISSQKIVHKQEQPPFTETSYYMVEDIFVGKIWVIDSREYVTMLLPEEY